MDEFTGTLLVFTPFIVFWTFILVNAFYSVFTGKDEGDGGW